MSDRVVAARALQSLRFSVDHIAVDCGSNVFVAAAASILGYAVIKARDLDGVGIPSRGEVKRVPESVVRFDGVLADEVVGRVAVVAGGGGVVTRLQPGVVLRAHDVTIDTGFGVVGEIGITLGVDKRVGAKANN